MLSKNIYIHSLNLLNDIAAVPETAKWAILERLELDIFVAPNHRGGQIKKFQPYHQATDCD